MITGSTRVFAILGNPVAHSLSPVMHNAAFRALGIEAAYVPLACAPEAVAPLIQALARGGGGGNVTVPYKEAAAGAVDVCRELAEMVGASNTFWGENGGSVGDNTDVQGLLEALRELDAPSGPWLIAGTGGAARAAVVAARERDVEVAVTSRDRNRLRDFEGWVTARGVTLALAAECRVLINSTPLGLKAEDPLPIANRPGPSGRSGARPGLRHERNRVDPGRAPPGAARGGWAGHAGGPGSGGLRALVSRAGGHR